jgi:hypothetical protein
MSPRITVAHLSGCKRLLHTSRPSFNFIGPPDPTSNIRPIIYTSSSFLSEPILPHPYSLKEFSDDTVDHELQWILHREQLDAFNHTYWAEVSLDVQCCYDQRFEETITRVTPASKLPNPQSFPHSLPMHPRKHTNTHCLSFTESGSFKNEHDRTSMMWSSGSGRLRVFRSLLKSNFRK